MKKLIALTLIVVCLGCFTLGCGGETKKDAAPAADPAAAAPKADAPKADAPKADAPKADAPKVDATKVDNAPALPSLEM